MGSSTDAPPVVPGDLVLVKTPRAPYALGRWIGRWRYDHIGVVVSAGQVLNVVVPVAVLTPLERMLTPEREPLVLRPRFDSEAQRASFVQEMESLAGVRYHVPRAIALILRVWLRKLFGVRWKLGHLPENARRLTCTDAVFAGLERHSPEFRRARELPLEWSELGCASSDDFLRLSRLRPDLLPRVAEEAPPPLR